MMIKLAVFCCLTGALFLYLPAQAQSDKTEETSRKFGYEAGLVGLASTEQTPFWLRANKFGIIPCNSPALMPNFMIKSDYRTSTNWDWGFKVDGIVILGQDSKLLLPEAHLKARWKKIEIIAGRKRQILGVVGDTLNTSGSYIQSGNALPMPMVQIGFTDYVPIFKDLFAFKGNFAHGWFSPNVVTKSHFLHQKSFYARFGRSNWPVRLYGGLNHQVQWGGTIVTPNKWTAPGQTRYPQSLQDYWWVITSKRIPTFGYVNPDDYDAIDRGNRIGNHLGSMDAAAEFNFFNFRFTAYKQFFYDDGSLFQMLNIADGLYGLSFKSLNTYSDVFTIKGLTVEYLYSVHQGGSHFDLEGGKRGRDNYFNHGQYKGWSYMNEGIGTPFIPHHKYTGSINRAENSTAFTLNNRVKLLHLGLNGKVGRLSYLAKASFSTNIGHYNFPVNPPKSQTSLLLQLEDDIKLGKQSLNLSMGLAGDFGELYKNTIGISLGIKKQGLF